MCDLCPIAGCCCRHIDGIPTATNGVTRYCPFTMLAGVALSDQAADFEGNLVVYPGSHRKVCDGFGKVFAETNTIWAPEERNPQYFPPGGVDGIVPKQLHLRVCEPNIARVPRVQHPPRLPQPLFSLFSLPTMLVVNLRTALDRRGRVGGRWRRVVATARVLTAMVVRVPKPNPVGSACRPEMSSCYIT
jgi:hypothetical protein